MRAEAAHSDSAGEPDNSDKGGDMLVFHKLIILMMGGETRDVISVCPAVYLFS